jgi:hypothetical protein
MPPAAAWWSGIIADLFIHTIIITRRKDRERSEALRHMAEAARLAFEAEAEFAAVHSRGDVQLFRRAAGAHPVVSSRLG